MKKSFINSAVKIVLLLCEIEKKQQKKGAQVEVYPLLPLHGVFADGAGGVISLWQSQYIIIISGICFPALGYLSKGGSRSVFTLWSRPVTWATLIHAGLNVTAEALTLKWTAWFDCIINSI